MCLDFVVVLEYGKQDQVSHEPIFDNRKLITSVYM